MTRIFLIILIAIGGSGVGIATAAQAEDLSYCEQGQTLYSEGDYSAAIGKTNQCITEGDLSDEAHACAVLNRGRSYLAMQQSDKGLGDIRSAISSDPALGDAERAAACMGIPEVAAARILGSAE